MSELPHSYAFNVKSLLDYLSAEWSIIQVPKTQSIRPYENRTGLIDELLFNRERFQGGVTIPLYTTITADKFGKTETLAIPAACIDMKVTHFVEETGMERDIVQIDERLSLDIWRTIQNSSGAILPPSKISFHATLNEPGDIYRPSLARTNSYGLIRKSALDLDRALPTRLFVGESPMQYPSRLQ